MPATTRSGGETKSVWANNNTDLQADQREKEKAKHAILLIVLPTLAFLLLVILVFVVIWLTVKRKKYRNIPSRLHTLVHTGSNERNLRKTFSSSDQSFTALVKE